MDGTSLIEVEHLHRRYGDLRAVEDVSFRLARGEVLGFLGPNGAGKTTTMNVIAGVLAPSAGRVCIDGIDLLDRPVAAKRHIGYLPEQPPLYPELIVDEYLAYCARLRSIGGEALRRAVGRAVERCGLGEVRGRLIGNLSKGYRQRVGIAQAIVHQPPVVVLDEPTVGLDPIQIREIRTLVRELGGEHGVVLSTHTLPEVQVACDRVLILHRGRLVLDESLPGLTSQRPSAQRVALRAPPGTERLARIEGVADVETLGAGRFRLRPAPGEEEALPERIAAEAARGEWGLRELMPEHGTLEEVFVRLTCGDDTAAPHDGPAGAVPGEVEAA